jgi:hypothetical protein
MKLVRMPWILALACLASSSPVAAQVNLNGLVTVVAGPSPIERNAVAMLLAEVRERHRLQWNEGKAAQPNAPQVILAIDASRDTGTDGYHIAAKGSTVRISATAPRGLLYGAADLLDQLQDSRIVPVQDRTEGPTGRLRSGSASVPCASGQSQRNDAFNSSLRFLARHRFNYVVLNPCELDSAIGYRHVAGLERPRSDAAVENIRAVITDARNWGLDVYLNYSGINYPNELIKLHPHLSATAPAGADRTYSPPTAGGTSTLYGRYGVKPNLCISEAKTWEFVEGHVREIAELFPAIAGLRTAVQGTDSDIFFCDCERCRPMSKPQRTLLFAQHVTQGLDRGSPGKKLIFRTYMGAWKNLLEPEIFGPLAGKLPKSVVIHNNAQYGDFYLFNSLTPLIGAFPGNDETYELDPGGEYHGGFFGLQPTISRYMDARVKAYAARGVTNVSLRNHQYRTDFSDLDWYVGSQLAWNDKADVERLRRTWARRNFGDEGGPLVLQLMDIGFEVMRKSLYADGINFTNWALFIESVNRTRHIMMDRSAKMADRGLERMAPTPENIARLIAEKDEAFQLAQQGLMLVDQARGKLSPRHLEGMRASFMLARELTRIYRPELEALMLYFQWQGTLSEVDRERLRAPVLSAVERTRAAVKEAGKNLSAINAREMCENLGMDWRAFKSNKGLFSQDLAVTAMDKNLALPYALQLMDDIEKQMDYVPASVFGYY